MWDSDSILSSRTPQATGSKSSDVDPNNPAAQAGLQPHDRVISIDGRPFKHHRHAKAYLSAQTGRPVPLMIERNGRQLLLHFVPGQPEGDSGWVGILLFGENEVPPNAQSALIGTAEHCGRQPERSQRSRRQPGPTGHNPEPIRHDPEPIGHNPEPIRHNPEPIRHDPEPIRHNPEPIRHNAVQRAKCAGPKRGARGPDLSRKPGRPRRLAAR